METENDSAITRVTVRFDGYINSFILLLFFFKEIMQLKHLTPKIC